MSWNDQFGRGTPPPSKILQVPMGNQSMPTFSTPRTSAMPLDTMISPTTDEMSRRARVNMNERPMSAVKQPAVSPQHQLRLPVVMTESGAQLDRHSFKRPKAEEDDEGPNKRARPMPELAEQSSNAMSRIREQASRPEQIFLNEWPQGHKTYLWEAFADSEDDGSEAQDQEALDALYRYIQRQHHQEQLLIRQEKQKARQRRLKRKAINAAALDSLAKTNLMGAVQTYAGSIAKQVRKVETIAPKPPVAPAPQVVRIEPILPERPLTEREKQDQRRRLWKEIARRDIPKAYRQFAQYSLNKVLNANKVAQLCQREVRRVAIMSNKRLRDMPFKGKRLVKETLSFWRRNEKEERDARKRAEKEDQERRKLDDELREAKRQQRKLNFLITQTELYSHFLAKKIAAVDTNATTATAAAIPSKAINTDSVEDDVPAIPVHASSIDFDSIDDKSLQDKARQNAKSALAAQQERLRSFDEAASKRRSEAGPARSLTQDTFDNSGFDLTAPSTMSTTELAQPQMLRCKLKGYQLKGLSWIYNLYEQGINGILADEMGLGKTVQSLALLSYLAESQNIWGPFLVVSPSSTLHNWQQEFERFAPDLKVLPYWGTARERKTLRQFWNQKQLYGKEASFHVLITSYQLVVQDEKYFQRIKWQYMILDEAQALKSSSSARWNILLKFNCRNRLLLTGTPIQNTMQELWALLHFIMPTLFDSHQEFADWFSKDIESHATGENEKGLDRHQLSRLHMILKPFMLRRIKKDVENELGEKIELDVSCQLTVRQKRLHRGLREKISVAELLQKSTMSDEQSITHLMNLVTQFRKVCNHPELFERRDVSSPLQFFDPAWSGYTAGAPILSAGTKLAGDPRSEAMPVVVNNHNPITFVLPKLLYRDSVWDSQQSGQTQGSQAWAINLFSIWSNLHILRQSTGSFSFSRLINLSPAEVLSQAKASDVLIASLLQFPIQQRNIEKLELLSDDDDDSVLGSRHRLLLRELSSPCSVAFKARAASKPRSFWSPLEHLCNVSSVFTTTEPQELSLHPFELRFYMPSLVAPPIGVYCSDRSFYLAQQQIELAAVHRTVLTGASQSMVDQDSIAELLQVGSVPVGGIERPLTEAAFETSGYSYVTLPDPDLLILDSGKLIALDRLLPKLKAEKHRVLIYCQMTKMIDIMEDYMHYRGYRYLRLDGSSKLSDRRDMVQDFQSRSDIFIFLLSTRAGGLGINLTAADTVIFYECDWNPTVDQQAMDRVHRLGQTKQVTVYRMITKGTIEERILTRAKQKHEIQKVVISGGEFKMEEFKNSREVLTLLLDEEELEEKLRAQQEQRLDEAAQKEQRRKQRLSLKRSAEDHVSPAASSEPTPAPVMTMPKLTIPIASASAASSSGTDGGSNDSGNSSSDVATMVRPLNILKIPVPKAPKAKNPPGRKRAKPAEKNLTIPAP